MKTAKTFLADFFAARDLSGPNGQPLYRYHITPEEFTDLERVLGWELRKKQFGQGPISRDAARAFCLWASEWSYRNYEGGPRKWEPLVSALGMPELAPSGSQYHVLRDVVTRGLRAWRRTIYRFGPSRGFLETIVCEGGLPLNLVLREDTHLSRYLRGLLGEFRQLGSTGIPPRDLASRLRRELPRAWQREVVYELAGELIQAIWRLQAELSNGASPVQELDGKRPGWRDELPIRVSDDVASVLLNGLLVKAIEVARRARSHVRWNVYLAPVADGDWELRGSFNLPTTIGREALQALFGFKSPDEVPSRLHLGVQTERRTFRALAQATEERIEDEGRFRLERTSFAREVQTRDLTGPRKLVARTYDEEYPSDQFPGASGLGDLAWVFGPMDPTDPPRSTCRLVGQGTLRVGEAWALLAVGARASVVSDEGCLEPAGSLRNAAQSHVSQRRVYRLRGKATITEADGSCVIVETNASADPHDIEYHLAGPTKRFGGDAMTVFLGGPVVHRRRDGEFVERVPERHLEWRPDIPGGRWGAYSCAAVASGTLRGAGRLRYVTNNIVRHSISICILPSEADIEIRPSSDTTQGEIRFTRFGNVMVGVQDTPGVRATGRPEPDGYRLSLHASGDAPRQVPIVVEWPEVGRMTLPLPFPARRAAFIAADGHRLPVGARLADGSVAGVHAEVVAPDRREYTLWGTMDRAPTFAPNIPEVSYGHHLLDLGQMDREVADRLGLADRLDAKIRLRIADGGSGATLPGADILVTRFDLAFRRVENGTTALVTLDERSLKQVSRDDLTSLVVELLPLLEPDQDVIPLRPCSKGAWRLPAPPLVPGPYLICGRQGDQQRVGPLPWYAPRPDRAAAGPLSGEAVTVAEAYAAAFDENQPFGDKPFRPVVRALAMDPGHEDWPLVFGYLGLESLPPMVFPLLRALVRNPMACAMAAADASEADFSVLWDRMEIFPFAWWQLPGRSWERAYLDYADHWRKELEAVGDTDLASDILNGQMDRSFDRVKARLAGLGPAFGFLNGRTTGRPIPRDSSRIVNPKILDALLENYDKQLRDCRAFDPESPTLLEMPGVREEIERVLDDYPWSVRLFLTTDRNVIEASGCADFVYTPALAAVLVMSEHAAGDDLAHRIRGARRGHSSWFDRTFEVAQLIAFGLREADNIQRKLGK